jgi:Predicted membrane protein (DUF2207).
MNLFFAFLLSWYIKEFNIILQLSEENLLKVEETITVDFQSEQRHGIYRTIPIKFRNSELPIKIISARCVDHKETQWTWRKGTDYINIRLAIQKSTSLVPLIYIHYE